MTTLNDALVDIIQKTQGAVESGVNFLSEQIPDVVHQLLVWKVTEALVWAGLELFLTLLSLYFIIKAISSIKEQCRLEDVEASLKRVWEESTRDEIKITRMAYEQARDLSAVNSARVVIDCIFGVPSLLLGVVSFCKMYGNILTSVQIYIAPKVWLIEYAAQLAK